MHVLSDRLHHRNCGDPSSGDGPSEIPAALLSTREVSVLIGVTYRQLDHWCRQGFIPGQSRFGPGSGNRRAWTEFDIERAEHIREIARLRNMTLREAIEA